MTNKVIIIGAGGHAKVLVDTVQQLSCFEMVGLTDVNLSVGDAVLGATIIGADDVIRSFANDEVLLVNGLGQQNVRKKIYEKYTRAGYVFASVLHSSVILSKHINVGAGLQIMAGAVVQANSHIGDNVIINTRASIDHDCVIGNDVHIAPGAILCGGVHIGDNTLVGAGTVVNPGIRIGENCIVGAGSVVVNNVSNGMKIAGVPAKSIENV